MLEQYKFIKQVLLFSLSLLLILLSCVIYFTVFSKSNFHFEFLYQYQLKKINNNKYCDTIIIGDSSLGNAIDASYFSELTPMRALNLALTGVYGYAGSYNILKKAYRENPSIKNVIIMQAINMSSRETSYQGYLNTINDFTDLRELNSFEKKKVFLSAFRIKGQIRAFISSNIKKIFKIKKNFLIINDYIQQQPQITPNKPTAGFSPEGIILDKYRFLKRILRFAKDNDLNLIYLHGPYFDGSVDLSSVYIKKVNENIQNIGINLVKETIGIPAEDLGDTTDHIKPKRKKYYTKKFTELIKSNNKFMARF